MADVKISLKIEDAGALEEIRKFNEAFKSVKINADKANRGLKEMTKAADNAGSKLKKFNTGAKKGFDDTTSGIKRSRKELGFLGKSFQSIKNIATGVFIADTLRQGITALKNAAADAVNGFVEFEAGLLNVAKTAGLTAKEMDELGQAIKGMDLPVSNAELSELATVAGQLGIKGTKNIARFTEVLGKLQLATDIVGSEGASQLARILNITGEGPEEVEKYADVLVTLGNNFAATESEILRVTSEVARATTAFGISSAEATAFGAALKSLGGRAEGGGTAIGKVFRQIQRAIAENGPLLKEFAKTMGTTGEALTKSFNENKTDTVIRFFESLSGKTSKETSIALKNLKLDSDRLAKVIPVLSTNYNVLEKSMAFVNGDLKENGSLNAEVEKKMEGLGAKTDALKKSISSLATSFVEDLAPPLKSTIDLLNSAIRFRLVKSGDINPASLSIKELNSQIAILQDAANSKTLRSTEVVQMLEKLKNARQAKKDIEEFGISLVGLSEGEVERALIKGQRVLELRKAQAAAELALAKKKEEDLKNLKLQFRELDLQLEQEEAENKQAFEEIKGEERFQRILESIGNERAIRLAGQAQRLLDEGKQQQALKLLRDAEIKAVEDVEKKKTDIQKKEQQARISIVSNLGALVNAAAGKQTKLGFALQKAAAIANVIIAGQQAQAAALAPPPLGLGPVKGAGLAGLIKGNTILQVGTIAATAIQGFQDGGIVPGASFSGDNVAARVNSGEMILNRQQQAQLFNVANGQQVSGSKEIVVNTSVQVGEEEIARAVSRQVANGFELGEQT